MILDNDIKKYVFVIFQKMRNIWLLIVSCIIYVLVCISIGECELLVICIKIVVLKIEVNLNLKF